MVPTSIGTLGRAVAVAACLGMAACTGGSSNAQPTIAPPAATAAPDSATPSPSSAATPRGAATPSLHPATIRPGDVVETLVSDVRVRSRPRVTDSVKLEPVLPAGTKLYVVDGPVAGSGYRWFWVAQLSSTQLPSGWVAAEGRDGEAWVGPGHYDCPTVPDDLQTLLALPRGAGLACFSRVPITFQARLFDCNCDPTPGSDWIDPNWLFSVGFGSPLMLEPSATRPYSTSPTGDVRLAPSLELLLDPKASAPASLPVGRYIEGDTWTIPPVVRITGMFNHPAAATCRWDSHSAPSEASLPLNPAVGTCRLEFAVTRIVVP